jgi:hypothetical protein
VEPAPQNTTASSGPPPADDPPRLLAQLGRAAAGGGRLRVRVAVGRQHLLADQVLDEVQRLPGCGHVRVDRPARAERGVEHGAAADRPHPDALDQVVGLVAAQPHRRCL